MREKKCYFLLIYRRTQAAHIKRNRNPFICAWLGDSKNMNVCNRIRLKITFKIMFLKILLSSKILVGFLKICLLMLHLYLVISKQFKALTQIIEVLK